LKVLWIIPGEDKGSSFIFSRRQVKKIQELGVEGRTYFLSSRTNIFSILKSRKEVKNICNEFQPDIVHAHYGTINGFFALTLGIKKSVVSFMGSDLNSVSSIGKFRDYLGKKASEYCYKKSSANITVSQSLKNLIPEKYHAKTVVIPVGVDEQLFRPIARNDAREKLGWNMQEKVILFNGNNPFVKRLDIAEQTLILVKECFPETRLEVLTGGINPEDMPWYINASDVVLLCSDSEGSPGIIKEAMSCNTAVVSNDVGDTRQRLQHMKGAILADQNPESLAAGIIEIFRQDRIVFDLREQLIRQGLTETLLSQHVITIYNQILTA
jgi:glycosyltransferase involved in cell wall biosynthesis